MKQHQASGCFRTRIRKGSLGILFLTLAVLLLAALSTSAQEERKPKNLKVLPKTISHDSLISIMSNFTVALGVECGYCHERNQTGRGMDFASDTKKTKLTARDMLKMVSKLNDSYLADLPTKSTAPQVDVQCYTCHRGQPKPRLLQDVLKAALDSSGMKGVDSTYRALRKKYYGSGTFNFSDETLAYLALDVAEKNPGNALDILKLNKEFNPNSLTTEWATGRVYVMQGDTTQAISAFESALKMDPNNRRIQHDLQMLRGGGPRQRPH